MQKLAIGKEKDVNYLILFSEILQELTIVQEINKE